MTDTLAGVTQVMFPSLFSAYPQLQSGKIRALAVAGPKRLASLPNLPTLAEAGVRASRCRSGMRCSRRRDWMRRWRAG